jgi:hypothetical protein
VGLASPACLCRALSSKRDLDGDGAVELITGSFHAYPPYERIARVTLWQR